MTEEGITPVDNMSDADLEKKASELCGEDLIVGPEKTGTPLESVESSVRAILVKMDGNGGAVKVYGAKIRHVVAGDGSGSVIVVINPGETSRLHGNPLVRYFRRRDS